MDQRLQKIIASMGIASRRKAEELIAGGKVTVNGVTAAIGAKADPLKDHIKVNGKLITGQRVVQKLYLLFNKPRGVVTTLSDPEGRPAINDFLKDIRHRVFPVGRLDYDSEGLLFLTNDGDFANSIMHPSKEMSKTYLAKIKGEIGEEGLDRLRKGIRLEDGVTMPAKAKKVRSSENNSWIEIVIYEGRNRQVRRMFDKVGHSVLKLKRIAIDGIRLGDLRPGEMRPLTAKELERIKSVSASD